jgi:arsenite methyltransferase
LNNPYEKEFFGKLESGVMRPGGLRLTDKLSQKCQFSEGASLLDIGCGTGMALEFLEKKYGIVCTGVDISKVNIEKGKKRNPKINLIVGDGTKLDFPTDAFDGILMECSLSVIGNKDSVLHDIYEILKPGGKFIITDIYLKTCYSGNNEAEKQDIIRASDKKTSTAGSKQGNSSYPHCLRGAFEINELIRTMESLGFKIIDWKDESEELKKFAIDIIMEYGSLNYFWKQFATCENKEIGNIKGVKLKQYGYFSMIAEKPEY